MEGAELLSLQVDVWAINGEQEWIDVTTDKIKKMFNHTIIKTENFGAVLYFDRTLYETSDDERLKRNTLFFDINYREREI